MISIYNKILHSTYMCLIRIFNTWHSCIDNTKVWKNRLPTITSIKSWPESLWSLKGHNDLHGEILYHSFHHASYAYFHDGCQWFCRAQCKGAVRLKQAHTSLSILSILRWIWLVVSKLLDSQAAVTMHDWTSCWRLVCHKSEVLYSKGFVNTRYSREEKEKPGARAHTQQQHRNCLSSQQDVRRTK